MVDVKEVLKIAGAFTGVIVGAGFASGQEIMQFFTSFGVLGLAGALVSSALFVFLAMALASFGQQQASPSHKQVIYAICGKYLGVFVDVLVTIFMLALAVVMLAGGGALLEQLAGVPLIWGSVATTVLVVLIVCLDVHKVIGLISAVTPLLMIMIVIVVSVAILGRDADLDTLSQAAAAQPRGADNWLVAALVYVSYNIVAGAPFLVIIGGQTRDRRTAILGGIAGGLLLGLLMLLLTGGIFARVDQLGGVDMPMLLLATQISPILGVIMGVTIFGMILNTAVGVLYSFSARVFEPSTAGFRWGTIIAGIAAFIGSLFGFTKLVGTVYPFFGYLGFVLMACIAVGWFRFRAGPARASDVSA